jgi:hypothetical protein
MKSKVTKTILLLACFFGLDYLLALPQGTLGFVLMYLYGLNSIKRRDSTALQTMFWFLIFLAPVFYALSAVLYALNPI